MSDLSFTSAAIVVLLSPTVIVPLMTMLFLRTQRARADYGLTRLLFLLGAVVWVALACWEAVDLRSSAITLNSPFQLQDILHADTFRPTLPRWLLLCLPAFPTLFAVLVMFRRRFSVG